MTPILGFAPDAAPTTPGVLTDCSNMLPTLRGMVGCGAAATPAGVPALAAACKGAVVVTKLDGTRRLIAGTTTNLYELSGGSWTSQGSGYSGGTDSQWSITQFGNSTIAANAADTIQRSTTTTFAAIAGAPVASIVFSVGAFVMALNTNTATDQWHCCAAYDETDWTESTTTQSASGRLVSTPGALTAGGRMGEYAIAYKNRAIYIGQYVGAPDIWDWQQVIGGQAGCVGKKAWADLDGTHFVVGDDNFWLFNGQTATPIGDNVLKEWFQEECDPSYKYKVECNYDKPRNLVWVFYPSAGSSTLNRALVYHVQSKKWGRVAQSVETTLEYVTGSVTIDGMDSSAATIDALPDISIDSPYWLDGARAFAIVNTSHQIQTLSSASSSSNITTGDVGDDFTFSLLDRVKARFITAPSAATLQHYYKNESGDSYSTGSLVNMSGNKFDVLWSARWHKALITFTGDVEITGLDAKYSADSEE